MVEVYSCSVEDIVSDTLATLQRDECILLVILSTVYPLVSLFLLLCFSQNAEDCLYSAGQDIDDFNIDFHHCQNIRWQENEPTSEDDYCTNFIDVCTKEILPDGLCQAVAYKYVNCHIKPYTTWQCSPPSKYFVLNALKKNLRA